MENHDKMSVNWNIQRQCNAYDSGSCEDNDGNFREIFIPLGMKMIRDVRFLFEMNLISNHFSQGPSFSFIAFVLMSVVKAHVPQFYNFINYLF